MDDIEEDAAAAAASAEANVPLDPSAAASTREVKLDERIGFLELDIAASASDKDDVAAVLDDAEGAAAAGTAAADPAADGRVMSRGTKRDKPRKPCYLVYSDLLNGVLLVGEGRRQSSWDLLLLFLLINND